MICDKCGTKCDANAKFCKVCSGTLADAAVQPVIPGIEDAPCVAVCNSGGYDNFLHMKPVTLVSSTV